MRSIYQDENWLKLQEKKEKGDAVQYIYKDENGKITYPFIKRIAGEINQVVYYDLVTARGESGIEVELYKNGNLELLINKFNLEFEQYCKQNNIIAEYIRFSPWKDSSENFKSIYNIKYHGNLYCVSLQEDFLYTQFSPSKRNKLRKAMKKGIDIKFDFEGKTTKEFIELYKFTENKYNVSEYYLLNEEFINDYFKKLKDKVFFIHAYFDGKLISSCLILLGEEIAHYHFSANNPEYKLQANTYLLYESMLYAKEKGKILFDLGGAIPGSSLELYKKGFINKKEECIYPYNIGTKIRNSEIYQALVKKAGGPREGYFPEYRR